MRKICGYGKCITSFHHGVDYLLTAAEQNLIGTAFSNNAGLDMKEAGRADGRLADCDPVGGLKLRLRKLIVGGQGMGRTADG